MIPKRLSLILLTLLALTFVLSACGADPEQVEVLVTRVVTEIQEQEIEIPVEVTRIVEMIQTRTVVEEVEVEVPAAVVALGSSDKPIKVLFVPSVDVETIVAGGEIIAAGLEAATGYEFEVSVPTSYAATIEEMCASPDDTIGFIPAQGYVLANDACGVTVGASAVRFGLPWYAAQIVVGADSGIETLADLEGKTWAIPDYGSTSGYLFPLAMFQSAGITPGDIVEAGGHGQAMLAVNSGDVDFATAFFSPPLLPNYERQWTYGVDDPEIWREVGESPVRNEAGRTFVGGDPADGGYRVLDARSSVAESAPEIFDNTRILALTDQIPNDSLSFGPEFPLNTANQIVDALDEWVDEDNPDCAASLCSEEFYNWTGIDPTTDGFYDAVRFLMDQLGITSEDVLGG